MPKSPEQKAAEKLARQQKAAEGTADEEVVSEAETQEDPSFADVTKSPEIEHAKKIARAASKAKKLVKPSRTFHTLKDGKVLKVSVNSSGAFSSFIDTKKKMEKRAKGSFDVQVKLWKKSGSWVSEEDYQEHCEKIKDELAKEG